MIALTDIRKRFGTLDVLRGVSLEVARGEVVAVVGASGAGKSTLLQIAGTLMRPDGGRVVIDGTDVGALGDRALSRFRNERIGFVFQFHHLLPEFTALENVMNDPAVLLADEPSGNLDSRNREEIHRLFFDLRNRTGQTVVIVTHDEGLAATADRRIVMSDGRVL